MWGCWIHFWRQFSHPQNVEKKFSEIARRFFLQLCSPLCKYLCIKTEFVDVLVRNNFRLNVFPYMRWFLKMLPKTDIEEIRTSPAHLRSKWGRGWIIHVVMRGSFLTILRNKKSKLLYFFHFATFISNNPSGYLIETVTRIKHSQIRRKEHIFNFESRLIQCSMSIRIRDILAPSGDSEHFKENTRIRPQMFLRGTQIKCCTRWSNSEKKVLKPNKIYKIRPICRGITHQW